MNWGPAGKAGKSPSMSNVVDVSGGSQPPLHLYTGPMEPWGSHGASFGDLEWVDQ